MSKIQPSSVASLLLPIALITCGGGGGSSNKPQGPPITVIVSPAAVSYSYPDGHQGFNKPQISVTATVNDLPNATIYPVVSATGNVLAAGPLPFRNNGDGSFTGSIFFNQDLQASTYTGNLILNLYTDSAHTIPYQVTGGTVPYTLTVTPGIVITAFVNGVQTPNSSLNVKSGDVVSLSSSIPVDWTGSSGGLIASNGSQTQSSWTATIRYGISTPGSQGRASICAVSLSAPDTEQAETCVDISVTE